MRDNIAVCYVVCVLPRRRCPHAFVLHAVGRTTNSSGFLSLSLSLARRAYVQLAAARVGHLTFPLSCCGASFALLWATFVISVHTSRPFPEAAAASAEGKQETQQKHQGWPVARDRSTSVRVRCMRLTTMKRKARLKPRCSLPPEWPQ